MSTDTKYSFIGEDTTMFKNNPKLINYILILAVASVFILITICLFFIVGYPEEHNQNVKKMKTKRFQHYYVDFDTEFNRPIRSVQFNWSYNVGTRPNNRFKPEPDVTNIVDADYKNSDYDRGHLSPWMGLGEESMSIINVVPQYKCHNEHVWEMFEIYVRDYHSTGTIETYPIYNDNFFNSKIDNSKKLYIPEKMCKKINNQEYCLRHSKELCIKPYAKTWCKKMEPSLPDVDLNCTFKNI